MGGWPCVSFPCIKPGGTLVYKFPIRHSGTFWYHSHSNFHLALGQVGPLIFDPAGPDPVEYDREHVIVLSDWSFMPPHTMIAKIKNAEGYFNRSEERRIGKECLSTCR